MELYMRTEVHGTMRHNMDGERLESRTWEDAAARAHQPRDNDVEVIHAA